MNKVNQMSEKKHEIKSLMNVEIKAVTEEGEIEGFGSTFDNEPDAQNDRINPKAFNRTLKSGHQIIMLSNHMPFNVIGRWDEIKKTSKGLHVKGTLNLEIEEARKVHSHLKHGDYSGMSIGFFTEKEHFEDDVRVIDEIKLVEVSITPFPANQNAVVTAVKSQVLQGFDELNQEQKNQILGYIDALKMSLVDTDSSTLEETSIVSDEEIDAVIEMKKEAADEGHSNQEPDKELIDSELLNSIKSLNQNTNKHLDSELLHSIQKLVSTFKDTKENVK